MSVIDALKPFNFVTDLLGKGAEKLCDSLGLPEAVGDIAKGLVGWHTGDVKLLMDGVMDLKDNALAFLDPARYARDLNLGAQEPTPPPSRKQALAVEQGRGGQGSPEAPASVDKSEKGAPGTESTPGSTPGNEKTPSASEAKGAAKAFLERFSDPESFMTAIRNGQLPDEVANSQSGMLMVQQRLHEIQRMFSLMTQMMQAMHEMEMAIVRNIRA